MGVQVEVALNHNTQNKAHATDFTLPFIIHVDFVSITISPFV